MAKTKQMPQEPPHRSPGRSRFNIPRKESPQIDGSYLDRLFADLQQQTAEQDEPGSPPIISEIETPRGEKSNIRVPAPDTNNDLAGNQRTTSSSAKIASLPSSVKTINRSASAPALERDVGRILPPPHALIEAEPASLTPIIAEEYSTFPSDSAPLVDEETLAKVARTSRLAAGELSILRLMIQLCRDRGTNSCYLKIPQLMSATGLSDRQAQRILKNLHNLELIEKLAEYSNLDRLGTLYRLKLQ